MEWDRIKHWILDSRHGQYSDLVCLGYSSGRQFYYQVVNGVWGWRPGIQSPWGLLRSCNVLDG